MGAILKMKFWLAMGLILLAAIGLLVVGVVQGAQNAAAMSKLRSSVEEAESKTRGQIKGPQWAAEQKKLSASYKKQLQTVMGELDTGDQHLDDPFVDPDTGELPRDPETGEPRPLDAVSWLRAYEVKMLSLIHI